MNSTKLFGSVCAAACCMAGAASAGVVGWWRFNGEGANVPNVAETGGVPDGTSRATDGTIRSITAYGANPSYGSDAAEMPVVTNLFQQVAPRLVDQHTGEVYGGGKSLHWEGSRKKGGVIIPFDEAFVLSNCTIEVVMRIPPEAASRSDRMFPLVQFGRDSLEGWFFAVYRGDNVAKGGVPYVRGNFVDMNDTDNLNKGSTVNTTSYVKDLPSLFDGRWHRMALRLNYWLNGSKPMVTAAYFIDGICCGGMTYNNWKSWKLSGNCPLAIGCQPYSGDGTRTFWGDIAEVRISDTALEENNFLVPLADGPVDKDTALLLTFDSAAKGLGFARQYAVPCQQTAGQGSTNYIWKARNWNIHNAATNNPFVPRWYMFTDVGNADHFVDELRPTLSDDTWGDTFGMDDTLFANHGSLNIPTYQPPGAAAPGTDTIDLPYPACLLPSGDFTMECVFKTEAESTAEMDTFIYCPFLKWGVTNGKVLTRGYETRYGNMVNITSSWTINDGQWHHSALVYKDKTMYQYLDYKYVGKMAATLHVATGTSETFFIGALAHSFNAGTSSTSAQAFRGKIDAVRITRRALTTGEFLSTRSNEKLMTVTFDDAEHPYAPGQTGAIAPTEGVAGALDGGELPQIVQSRGGWYVLDGEGGTNTVECGTAVKMAGSYVLWPHTAVLERNAFTVEFFAKIFPETESANLLRCCLGTHYNDIPAWVLWHNGTTLHLSGRLSTDGGASFGPQVNVFHENCAINDNVWHHWGLVVDGTSGTSVTATVYRDYEPLASGTYDGQLFYQTGTCLTLGGTGTEARLHALVDNIRISAGILPVDKFMRYDTARGTVFIVR